VSKKLNWLFQATNIQVMIWAVLAICILPSRSHFLYDEAYYYHYALNLARDHIFTSLGVSISGTSPAVFTPGGGPVGNPFSSVFDFY